MPPAPRTSKTDAMPFRPSQAENRARREADKARNMAALVSPSRAVSRGVYASTSTVARPKSAPKRCPALLAMAKDRPCLLRVPLVCTGGTATTVACHSNLGRHGKSGGRKADEPFSCWGCSACHRWLDQGPAPAEEKEAVFMSAHVRQVLEWRRIAQDPAEPKRFRRAAAWALDQLKEPS